MLKELLKELLREELQGEQKLVEKNQNNIIIEKLTDIDKFWIGKKVIIRTYSAGVFFGEVFMKIGEEVIIKNARRLYYWETLNKGLSLSEVAIDGLTDNSKVCQAVNNIYLIAIELIECSSQAIKNIEGQNEYKA